MASARPQSVRPTRTIRMPPISSFYKVSKPISKKKFCSNLRTIFKAKDTARFRTRKLCSDLDLTTNTKIKPRPTVSPLTAKPVAEPRFSATGSPYFSPPTTAELEWLYPTRAGWSWSPFTPVVCENKFTYPTATQSQSDLVAENNIVESEKSLKVRENAAYCSLQALVRGKTEIRELGEGEESTAKQYMESFLTSIISRLADRAESANSNIVSITDVVAVLKEVPGWNYYYGFKPAN